MTNLDGPTRRNAAPALSDMSTDKLWSPSMDYDARNIEQILVPFKTRDRSVQAGKVTQEAACQSGGGSSIEGGFQYIAPDDMSEGDKQELLHPELMRNFLDIILPRAELVLLQNAMLDIKEDELAGLGDDDTAVTVPGTKKDTSLVELQSFVDLLYTHGRSVTDLQWLPHRKEAIAMACTESQWNSHGSQHGVLVWNFVDVLQPEYVLDAPVEVGTFQINPGMPHMVVGGCATGQVMLWDTSSHEEHLAMPSSKTAYATDGKKAPASIPHRYISGVEYSHRGPVQAVQWLPGMNITKEGAHPPTGEESSRPGNEAAFFASTAHDGRVLFWDMRVWRLKKTKRELHDSEVLWKPVFLVALKSFGGVDVPCSCISFPGAAHSNRPMLIGLEDKQLVSESYCRADSAQAADALEAEKEAPASASQQAHSSGVVALAVSPFFDDLVVSAGGWDWALWQVDHLEAPLMRSAAAPCAYTCVAWSTTRPGVLFAGRADGLVEAWDLLDRTHEPVLVSAASNVAVTRFGITPDAPTPAGSKRAPAQQRLAVGDALGLLHVMEVPRSLRKRMPGESKGLAALVQREQEHLKFLAASSSSHAASVTASTKGPMNQSSSVDQKKERALNVAEEEERIQELEYQKMEAQYCADWGLVPPTGALFAGRADGPAWDLLVSAAYTVALTG
ncbi:g4984 [Coccomyxa elongata]